VVVSGLTGAASIGAGNNHTCARTESGAVKCWGYNYYGQLGDATTTNRSTPVSVVGLPGPVELLAVGYQHTCALTETHDLYCWGSGAYGQLGDGTTVASVKPSKVRLP
jgi:alpha-tubulin suppressor-like RCC1 family protein